MSEKATTAQSSYRSRVQRERDEKLAKIREQIADGSLIIRRMTKAERLLYGPAKPVDARTAARRARQRSLARPNWTDLDETIDEAA